MLKNISFIGISSAFERFTIYLVENQFQELKQKIL